MMKSKSGVGRRRYVPHTAKQSRVLEEDRFADYAYLNFSTAAVVSSMFGAAISQSLDSPHE